MIPSLILSLKLPGRDCFDSLWVSTRGSIASTPVCQVVVVVIEHASKEGRRMVE